MSFAFDPVEERYRWELRAEALALTLIRAGVAGYSGARDAADLEAMIGEARELAATQEYRERRFGRANVADIIAGRRKLNDAAAFDRWPRDLERSAAECVAELRAVRLRFHPGSAVADVEHGPIEYWLACRACVERHLPPPKSHDQLDDELRAYWPTIEGIEGGRADDADLRDVGERVRYFDFWARRLRVPGAPPRPNVVTVDARAALEFLYAVSASLKTERIEMGRAESAIRMRIEGREATPLLLPPSTPLPPGEPTPPPDVDERDVWILDALAAAGRTLSQEEIEGAIDRHPDGDRSLSVRTIGPRVRRLCDVGLVRTLKERLGYSITDAGRAALARAGKRAA